MKLRFVLTPLTRQTELPKKLAVLGSATPIVRIFATILIHSTEKDLILKGKAVIDTGAILSLLPSDILKQLPARKTFSHTLWGIVDKKECLLDVRLASIPVTLIDDFGMIAHEINIVCAFTEEQRAPMLLGMKDFLEKFKYEYDQVTKEFSIYFPKL